MSDFKIEKGIPVPSIQRRKGKNVLYPFEEMEAGDSFLIEGPEKETLDRAKRLTNYHSLMKRPKKFVAAFVGDGTRIWRTA